MRWHFCGESVPKGLGITEHLYIGVLGSRGGAKFVEGVQHDAADAVEDVEIDLHLGGFNAFVERRGVAMVDKGERSVIWFAFRSNDITCFRFVRGARTGG